MIFLNRNYCENDCVLIQNAFNVSVKLWKLNPWLNARFWHILVWCTIGNILLCYSVLLCEGHKCGLHNKGPSGVLLAKPWLLSRIKCGQHLEKQVRTLSGVSPFKHAPHNRWQSVLFSPTGNTQYSLGEGAAPGRNVPEEGGPFMCWCWYHMYSGPFGNINKRKAIYRQYTDAAARFETLQAMTRSTSWAQTGFVIGNWHAKIQVQKMPMRIRLAELKLNGNESPEREETPSHRQLAT